MTSKQAVTVHCAYVITEAKSGAVGISHQRGLVKGDFLDAMPQRYERQLKAMARLLGSVKVWKQKQEHEPIGKLQAIHLGMHGGREGGVEGRGSGDRGERRRDR